jgi:hypothetical protein
LCGDRQRKRRKKDKQQKQFLFKDVHFFHGMIINMINTINIAEQRYGKYIFIFPSLPEKVVINKI